MASKLAEAVLYVAQRSKADLWFGATKLNKILFYADFMCFGETGESVTGATYMHLDYGPVPREMPATLNVLEGEGKLKRQEKKIKGRHTQKRVIALAEPNLSVFTPEAKAFLDEAIEALSRLNATEASDWTHRLNPWILTERGEEIPYSSVFVMKALPAGRSGVAWARGELERLCEEDGYDATS